MRISILAWVPCLILLAAMPAFSAEIGDPAAPLSIAKWAKGQSVDLDAVRGKQVVVVEFWATWCGPCLSSIPHLTEMAKKYKQDAVFVGVTREEAEVVLPFVEKMGDKMDYVVAIDREDKTTNAYMRAFNQGGIPHAFIVDREGKIAWHAHPMEDEFEKALQAVIAGKFDAKAALKQREEQIRIAGLMREYFDLVAEKEKSENLEAMERQIIDAIWQSEGQLDTFAWNIATRKSAHQNLELALKAAKQACALSDNNSASAHETCARVLWELGQKDEAVKHQRLAVEHAKNDREREALEKTLDEYSAR